MSTKASFSNRVRNYREREGISQDELAKRLGISRNYVSMIEGGREPSDQVMRHFTLIEAAPEIPAERRQGETAVKETSPDYNLVKKIIFIEEEGSPEQLALVDSFLDSVCEQLGLPRDRKPDRSRSKPSSEKH